MHDLKQITENVELYKKNLKRRGFDISQFDEIISLNEKRKPLIREVEDNRSKVKSLSKEIGQLKRKGENADEMMGQVSKLKESQSSNDEKLNKIKNDVNYLLMTIPNLMEEDTPKGMTEEENLEFKKYLEPKKLDFEAKEHSDLGVNLKQLDFDAAAKITGARFVVYKGDIARLERALINFMLDQHIEKGYQEIIPPFIVHERSLLGTGQLPKFEEDLFKLEGTKWYLTPTAEVPLTNLKREELFSIKDLPFKYVAYTPCFRSEAGSYGKDVKGIIRQHQFNKVELVNIVEPENSTKTLGEMVERACSILEALELPYRAVRLCEGELGFGAKRTVDLEVWLPGQNKYREISSLSNCGDFQARRAGIRFRGKDGKPQFAHTLNGSGLAVGRTVVAIMENYQNSDGTICVPEVLKNYMGGKATILPI